MVTDQKRVSDPPNRSQIRKPGGRIFRLYREGGFPVDFWRKSEREQGGGPETSAKITTPTATFPKEMKP